MNRRISWITVAAATMVVTVMFVARPMPIPAVPPPVRLEGELLLHGGTPNGLVVAPNPTIQLTGATSTTLDSADSPSPDSTDSDPAGSISASVDSDSADSPDD